METLNQARELLAFLEEVPLFAAGLAALGEAEFLAVASRAHRLLLARAMRAGLITAAEMDDQAGMRRSA